MHTYELIVLYIAYLQNKHNSQTNICNYFVSIIQIPIAVFSTLARTETRPAPVRASEALFPHGSLTRGTEAGYLFHPRVNNDLHAFAGHAGLHGLLCLLQREAMAEQTLPREGILVAEHHFHHGFVFIVRVIRHADNTQLARIEINGHGILSLLSPVLPVNRPYILYFITEFQYEVKKLKSHKSITL